MRLSFLSIPSFAMRVPESKANTRCEFSTLAMTKLRTRGISNDKIMPPCFTPDSTWSSPNYKIMVATQFRKEQRVFFHLESIIYRLQPVVVTADFRVYIHQVSDLTPVPSSHSLATR